VTDVTLARREELHRRGLRLEWFTVAWNVVEALIAIGVGVVVESVALVGFGVDSGIEVISAVALLWRLLLSGEGSESSTVALVLSVVSILVMPTLAYLKGRTGRELRSRALVADSVETWVCAYLSVALLAAVGLNAAFGWWWADPVGALAMLPVIVWQGWETLEEAREEVEE
jgi:divalent metal cation (Fe/Co/Zn/Cd) transporter